MYVWDGQSARSVAPGYVSQPGESDPLPTWPPQPGELPSYDVWALALANAPLVAQAQDLLTKSDVTYIRTMEADIPWPPSWATYRTALRAVVAGKSTTLPAIPALYPDGTATTAA